MIDNSHSFIDNMKRPSKYCQQFENKYRIKVSIIQTMYFMSTAIVEFWKMKNNLFKGKTELSKHDKYQNKKIMNNDTPSRIKIIRKPENLGVILSGIGK